MERNSEASSYQNTIGYWLGYPEASNNTAAASGNKPRQSCAEGIEVRLNAFLAPALNGSFSEDSRSGYFVSRKSTYPSRRNLHGLQNRSGRFGEQNNPWPATRSKTFTDKDESQFVCSFRFMSL